MQGQKDWPVYGHDPGGMRYSPLKQINTTNVMKLQTAWTIDTQAPVTQAPVTPAPVTPPAVTQALGTPAPPGPGREGAQASQGGAARGGRGGRGGPRLRGSESTPLVIGGVLYMGTGYNRVLALEPETGKKIWEYEGQHNLALRGIAYWPGNKQLPPQIVAGTADGWLFSLNAHTGKLVPGFGDEGMVNLRQGIPEKFHNNAYGLSSPPTVYKDIAITGAHVQESPSLGPPGDIRGWDMKTGKLAWTFHTIPRPGEPNHEVWQEDQWADRSGANPWGIMTIDAERGILFAGIGTPTRDFDGSDRKGSNLYGSSIVALDAATGKLKWYFQTTHHDNWDYDPSAPPALIEVVQHGKRIPALAQTTKEGLLFILDRLTGKPVFGVEERPVPVDNAVPGDDPWPTQPFPVKPPPLTRDSFQLDEVAKVTPEQEKFCEALLATEGGALAGGPYALYGPKLRVIFPSWIGGGNWGGVSFDPHLGYIFVNTQDLGNFNKMIKGGRDGQTYVRVGPDDRSLGADSSLFVNPHTHWPCQAPPWGELTAVNANTGEIAWKVPFGSFKELDAMGVPKTGMRNVGGSIVTAGGLVFIGATEDQKFHAFDSRTGKQLWETELVDVAHSVPITFEGKNGKQYVAVMAGGGNSGARGPGRLYVYALP
jgi:quinoprotein glucose dehydrogenase